MRTSLVLVLLLCLCADSFGQECRRDLLVNIDFPGTDIESVYSPDVHHCQQMCTQHHSCLFFTFLRADWAGDNRNFFCYLKRTDSGQPHVQTAVLGVTSGFSLKPCSIKSATCFDQVYLDTDFPGADYRAFFTANYNDCQRACTHDPSCQFFTWANERFSDVKIRYKCHLKFSWTVPVTPIVRKDTPPTRVSGFFQNAQISTNRNFFEECQNQYFQSTDIPGNNLLNMPAGSPEHCQILCAAHPSCTYFSFEGTTCFLKNNPNEMVTVAKQGVTSGLPSRLCQQNKNWLSVALDLDFPHSDISFKVMDDGESCRKHCNNDANCLFYSYVMSNGPPALSRRCYVKRVVQIPAPPKVTKVANAVSGFHLRDCERQTASKCAKCSFDCSS